MSEPSNSLRQLIDTLVPPKEIRVVDITGREWIAPAAIPARAQSRATAKLMEILDLPATGDSLKGLAGLEAAPAADQIQAMLTGVRSLLTEERVLDLVAETAEIAFPAIIRAAREHVSSLNGGASIKNAADLFEADQLLGFLSPFIVRLLAGMRDQMATLLPQ